MPVGRLRLLALAGVIHPPHDPDRCCRVCHAEAVTAGAIALAEGVAPVDPLQDEPAGPIWVPPEHGDGQRSLSDHLQFDRARKRRSAGLRQLDESCGDWAG